MSKSEADSNLHERPLSELKRKVIVKGAYNGFVVEEAKSETLVNEPAVFTKVGKHKGFVTEPARFNISPR